MRCCLHLTTFAIIMFGISSLAVAQTPSVTATPHVATKENPFNVGLQVNTLLQPGVTFGVGVGKRWRLEWDLNMSFDSYSYSDEGEGDPTTTNQKNGNLTLGMRMYRLFELNPSDRLYLGAQIKGSINQLFASNVDMQSRSWSLAVGPTFGAEHIFGNRFGLAIEIQPTAQYGSSTQATTDSTIESSQWGAALSGRLMARYYF